MKILKSFLALSATLLFAVIPNSAFADSVKVSASVSTEIKVEINSDSETVTYSGIIVDCRGLGLQTAASPVIKTESGKIIYGDKDLDFDKINEIGMAAYATSIEESTERVGKHPLIVRAIEMDKMKSNPVLRNIDAEKVVKADELTGFFKDLKVVFLTD